MALVHDLEQAEAGDIPSRGDEERKVMSTGEKKQREVDAMKKLVPEKAESIFELWNEHMEMETEGAQFVEDMEQVDMVLQALKYEKDSRYSPEDNPDFSSYPAMDEFFISADENIQGEKGRELFKKIREEYRKVKGG
jgi:putative hydrolase of HD superfamily